MLASSGQSVLGSLLMEKVFLCFNPFSPVSILFSLEVSALHLQEGSV